MHELSVPGAGSNAAGAPTGRTLWVKRDDETHALYGGNKVRKLDRWLQVARQRGATRLLTLGAVGSHHVLATVTHGAAAGFPVTAVLVPQPWSAHAERNVRLGIARGLVPVAASSYAAAPFHLARLRARRGTFYVPLGGTGVLGALGYADAAMELASQVAEGLLPAPDVIVAALGSGGTVAGLLAGLERTPLDARVVGVAVSAPVAFLGWSARRLARACTRRLAREPVGRERYAMRAMPDGAPARFLVEGRYLGGGYGVATAEGERASELAARVGLPLEPTYTAKAFAAALDLAGSPQKVLYWHTLAARTPLLAGEEAALEKPLPRAIDRLFQGPRGSWRS